MREMRVTVKNLVDALCTVEMAGGQIQREYAFNDAIWVPAKSAYDLNKAYLRIRTYTKNMPPTKNVINVILVQKRTDFNDQGKEGQVVLRQEFDREDEATSFMKRQFSKMVHGFSYERTGTQYRLDEMDVFVEDIHGYKPSVEIESPTIEKARAFLRTLDVEEILQESLPAIMRKVLGK